MPSRPSYLLIGVLLATLAAIGLITWIAWYVTQPEPVAAMGEVSSVAVTPSVQIGGPFALTDHMGNSVTEKTWRGKLTLIYFGYGFCPDVCPTELQIMSNALDALKARGESVQPLFITVDPERDTQEFLADYVTHFHPRLIGLTGSKESIAKAAKAFRVYYEKVEDGSSTDYLMNHSSFIYLMGRNGEFLTMFRAGSDAATMARTIASYLDK
jgi:cytochrome oxidase Cu insertion factor (SCO1/SenC/PrrC family)